jgi:hypothetical protein
VPAHKPKPSLTRHALDRVVDPQQRDRGLERALERAHLADGRLEHARGDVVAHAARVALARPQVEPVAQQRLLGVARGRGLRGVVERAQARDELRRVARGVDGERLGDHEQRGGKLGDRELLTRALGVRVVVSVIEEEEEERARTSVVAKLSR